MMKVLVSIARASSAAVMLPRPATSARGGGSVLVRGQRSDGRYKLELVKGVAPCRWSCPSPILAKPTTAATEPSDCYGLPNIIYVYNPASAARTATEQSARPRARTSSDQLGRAHAASMSQGWTGHRLSDRTPRLSAFLRPSQQTTKRSTTFVHAGEHPSKGLAVRILDDAVIRVLVRLRDLARRVNRLVPEDGVRAHHTIGSEAPISRRQEKKKREIKREGQDSHRDGSKIM